MGDKQSRPPTTIPEARAHLRRCGWRALADDLDMLAQALAYFAAGHKPPGGLMAVVERHVAAFKAEVPAFDPAPKTQPAMLSLHCPEAHIAGLVVVAPKDKLAVATLAHTHKGAREAAARIYGKPWLALYRQGYRIRPVSGTVRMPARWVDENTNP